MDPAEEIVSLWLKQRGFFIMNEVKVGYRGKEIDFLAFDPKDGRRVHVEVHASVRPLAPLRPWGPAKYGKWIQLKGSLKSTVWKSSSLRTY